MVVPPSDPAFGARRCSHEKKSNKTAKSCTGGWGNPSEANVRGKCVLRPSRGNIWQETVQLQRLPLAEFFALQFRNLKTQMIPSMLAWFNSGVHATSQKAEICKLWIPPHQLQHGTAYCMLLSTVTYHTVLQHITCYNNSLQHTTTCYQHITTYWNALQCIVTCHTILKRTTPYYIILKRTAVYYFVLQCSTVELRAFRRIGVFQEFQRFCVSACKRICTGSGISAYQCIVVFMKVPSYRRMSSNRRIA